MLRAAHRKVFTSGKVSEAFRPTSAGAHVGVVLPSAIGYPNVAPTLRATNTAITVSGANRRVTLPAGSAVGDLVIFYTTDVANSTSANIVYAAGTLLAQAASTYRTDVCSRVLDSTDVANGYLQFAAGSGSPTYDVCTIGFSLSTGASPVASSASIATTTSTGSIATPAITPDRLATFLSFVRSEPGSANPTVSSPATRQALLQDVTNQIALASATSPVDATSGSTTHTWSLPTNDNFDRLFSCLVADH